MIMMENLEFVDLEYGKKSKTTIEYAISKRAHLAYLDKYTFSYECNLKASLHIICSKKAQLWY